MLRLASFDVVFREIPGEVTLALNLSECPNRCPGCHSPHLREAVGEPLDETLLEELLAQYGASITCVCFMGGDGDPREVARLSGRVRELSHGALKTGWYSGREELPREVDRRQFDYLKLGPYVAHLGGLDSPRTNQRFYRIGPDGRMTDRTADFLHRGPEPL
ncbi:MAG: anaerobic ribonucleoside-triphosphate reductase activating protein [Alistipes sp.]|nr:anaerobic ribonucleoside-triphosphate reductase activating protein [Alistipes sp.]